MSDDGYRITRARKSHLCSMPPCGKTIEPGETYYRLERPPWVCITPDDLIRAWVEGGCLSPMPTQKDWDEMVILDKMCNPCYEMTAVEILADDLMPLQGPPYVTRFFVERER